MTEPAESANLLTLSHDQLTITLGPTLTAQRQLVYQDAHRHLSFTGDALETEQTALGTLVTVQLSATPDLGATTFTVLVPAVSVLPGEAVPVRTVGITTVHRTSLAPQLQHGQADSYTVTKLDGTAQFVLT